MHSPRRLLVLTTTAVALTAAALVPTGCKPKNNSAASPEATAKKAAPEPFTGKLTEIDGIQAVYTLRHPKLILADLDKLMTEIPEASIARMFLGQLAPYGYPEFSDFAPDTNIGIAVLDFTPEEISSGNVSFVAFAQLKEGGKIATLLKQSGLILEKRGDWTWITKNPAHFARVKAPDAVLAHITQPQTAELRAWGRLSPDLLARGKEFLAGKIDARLADRPEAERKAAAGYFNVAWGYLEQLQSLGGSLDLGDRGLTLESTAQFYPDSATGKWLRYAPGPAPVQLAASLPADAPITAAARQNMPGQIEFATGLFDALLAVDYPPAAEPLKAAKDAYLGYARQTDGGALMAFDLPLAPAAGQPPQFDMFGVQSGAFTREKIAALYATAGKLTPKLNESLTTATSAVAPGAPRTRVEQQPKSNALEIDGVTFDAQVTTATTTSDGTPPQTATTTLYYGVVDGNLVYATSEAALRAKLPALKAKRPVENPISATFSGDEAYIVSVHGANLVDKAAAAAGLDLTDADIAAQLTATRGAFNAAGPATLTVGASQARATFTLAVPYKFVAQSVRLAQYLKAKSP